MQTATYRYISSVILIITLLFISACDKGDDATIDPIVGKYKFVSAKLTADTGLAGFGNGDDASTVIRNSIFQSITCTNSANTALELRKTQELYFLCVSESKEVKGGTWSHAIETELVLNVTTAIGPVSVTVKNLVIAGNTLSGQFGPLPIPKNLYTNDPADAAILIQTQAELVFEKQ